MPKVTPFLWFDHQAEKAARYYVSIFPRSKVRDILRYDDASSRASGQPKGSVLTVAFDLDGQPFTVLNGGPHFQFTEAVSFVVHCRTQKEVDYYWRKLSAGGRPGQCGWLKDRFGVSWQVVPAILPQLLGGRDPAKSARAMQALMKMTKLDIARLQRAYRGR